MKIFKLMRHLDERGVSVVLGAILLLGIGIAVGSLWYASEVQSTIHSTEAGFMEDIGGTFVQLQSAIVAMGENQWSIANVKMSPSFPFFIPIRGEVGRLTASKGFNSYSSQPISENVINLITGKYFGSLSTLSFNDNSYVEINQVIDSQLFPNIAGWTINPIPPKTTGAADFDPITTYPQSEIPLTGAIRAFASSANNGQENVYFEHDYSNTLANYKDNVSLVAAFGKLVTQSGNLPPDITAQWRIDIENSYQVTTTGNLYAHQENTLISGTNYFSLKTSGPDAAGTNLSVSTENTGRQLWGSFVYPLAGFNTIPASTWNIDYRSWLSTVAPITITNSPTLASAGWTNPNNAFADGGGYASIISDNIDNTPTPQTYQGYGFDNIPAGSDITSVRVRYDAWTAGIASSITLLPNASGYETSLAGVVGASAHWQACTSDDSDTSYVYGTGQNFARDLYELDNTAKTGTIDNVIVYARVRGSISGNGLGETSIRTRGVTYDNTTAFNVTTSYQTFSTTYTTNPAGGNWTWNDINSLQAGVQLKRPSSQENTRCTYVWVVVNYHQLNDNIRVYVSGNNGNSWSSPQITSLTLSENTYWDNVTAISWTLDNLNDNNFRVKVDTVAAGAAGEVRLDWIPVEVTYTIPTAVAQASVDILIRKADNTIRKTENTNVALANLNFIENTLQASYSFGGYSAFDQSDYLEIDYYCNVLSSGPSGTAYLKIDNSSLSTSLQTRVENVTLGYASSSWNIGVIPLIENNDVSTIGSRVWTLHWTDNNPIKGWVSGIRVYMDAESILNGNHSGDLSVFTDDINLLTGPPFLINTLIGSKPIPTKDVDNIVLKIGFWSKDTFGLKSGPVSDNYTLQILNENTQNWENFTFRPTFADAVGPNKVEWVENIGGANRTTENDNALHYMDNDGKVWLNMKGTSNDGFPFSLCIDYVNFAVNPPISGQDNGTNTIVNYFYGSSGLLEFDMNLYSYPDQSYIYDDGAVILVQENTSVMVSPPAPDLVDVRDNGYGIRVFLNHYALNGPTSSVVKSGYASFRIELVGVSPDNWHQSPTSIEITAGSPLTADAWAGYFQSLADRLNHDSSYSFFQTYYLATADGPKLTLATSTGTIFYENKIKFFNYYIS